MNEAKIRRSLKLLQISSFLVGATFFVPIINIFYAKDLGMTLAQVGYLQAIFMVSVILLDVPTGWLADRYSRRLANFIGLSFGVLGFSLYAMSLNFWYAVAAEITWGLGVAAAGGADRALLDGYCRQLSETEAGANKMFTKYQAKLGSLVFYAGLISMPIGSLAGAYNPRIALWLEAAVFLVAAVIAWFQVDVGARHRTADHPLKDMAKIIKYAVHGHKPLAMAVFAQAVGNETTHVLFWFFTPLMLMAGVPVWLLGFGWAINMLSGLAGNWLASKLYDRLSAWQRLALGASLAVSSALLLSVNISLFTVWTIGIFGMVRGWFGVVSPVLVRSLAPAELQNSISSVATSAQRLLYLPLILIIPAIADHSMKTAMLVTAITVTVLTGFMAWKLWQYRAKIDRL